MKINWKILLVVVVFVGALMYFTNYYRKSIDIQPENNPEQINRVIPDVTFNEYKNQERRFSGSKTYEQILTLNDDRATRNYLEFPKWAGFYLPLYTIDGVEEMDIDNDEKKEQIIYYSCSGCNAPPRSLDIIKDMTIIFTANGASLELKPLTNEKGFYLETAIIPRDSGAITRVKFLTNDDGKLYPFSEEDVTLVK